jgi:hypothetical protein
MVGPLGDKIDDAIVPCKSYGCNSFEIYKSDLENQRITVMVWTALC